MNKPRAFFSDIRAWILLFFILRLFGITNPPLEVAHNWRQTTVTMVARNFMEVDADVFYPRIDIGGERTGITGMEFPLLNYLVYLVSLVVGYDHWYGRLINLIVSSIGLWFFYKIVKKYFSDSMAFNATFLLIVSVWLSYSRKIMPDTFSMSLLLTGCYHGSNYVDREKSVKNILLYFVLVLLGVLSKLPSGYLLIVFVLLFVKKETGRQQRIVFLTANAVMLAIISLYYFYWVPFLVNHYGLDHFFMGKSLSAGFSETLQHLDQFSQKFYAEALGYSGFLVFLCGLFMVIRKKQKALLAVFALSLLAFMIIVLKAGYAFYHHSYYIVPFAPVMSLVAAYALEHASRPVWAYLILGLVTLEAIPTRNQDFYIKEENLAIMKLESVLDSLGSRSDLVLINSGNLPTPLYFAHRKGWVEYQENLDNTPRIDSLKQKGLRFVVVLKRAFGQDKELPYEQVLNNQDFRIYKL